MPYKTVLELQIEALFDEVEEKLAAIRALQSRLPIDEAEPFYQEAQTEHGDCCPACGIRLSILGELSDDG
jgi:hypothetical protein